MAKKISSASIIEAAGTKPKIIQEFIGRVNSETSDISIAHMKSPKGWEEPGQTPQFDEYTLVLSGKLHVQTQNEQIVVEGGQAIICYKNEWIQYSTPEHDTEYIAVCLPAFHPNTVHRDDE